MSIPLTSIDCPCLTNECLNILNEHYSIHTTNDFLLWLIKSSEKNQYLSSNTIECIQSCLIAHTANISSREIIEKTSYQLNNPFFDNNHLLKSPRHLIFLYENFNQYQWNEFFNLLLLRLFITNPMIIIKYLNTNTSLFDINYFYTNYSNLNKNFHEKKTSIFENFLYFNQCFDIETLENELNLIENNNSNESIHILIIDDFCSLIKPYLNLDKRIKNKILQLTYRLNSLAQKNSILIINGMTLNTKKRRNHSEENSQSVTDVRFDAFQADKYILLQSLLPVEKEISIQILNENQSTILDLEDWRNI